MTELTIERVAELFTYDPESGIVRRKIDHNRCKAGDAVGSLSAGGYLSVRIDKKAYYVHRLAWFMTYGRWPEGVIDHIDGDRLNNKLANLRDASSLVNMQNTLKPKGKQRLLGVSLHRGKYWKAGIRVNGKQTHLGYFETPELAHEAHMKAKRALHSGLVESAAGAQQQDDHAGSPAPSRVDLPARVVDTVAASVGLSGPFDQDFYDFAQALMMEVLARAPAPSAESSKAALSDDDVVELRAEHGWAKETIRAIERAILARAGIGESRHE